jgi:hypothetical protein
VKRWEREEERKWGERRGGEAKKRVQEGAKEREERREERGYLYGVNRISTTSPAHFSEISGARR